MALCSYSDVETFLQLDVDSAAQMVQGCFLKAPRSVLKGVPSTFITLPMSQ